MYTKIEMIDGEQVTSQRESWYDVLKIGLLGFPIMILIAIWLLFATPFAAIQAAWEEYTS